MTRAIRPVVFGLAGILSGCMPPGGSVSGTVQDEAGELIPTAAILVDFGDGTAFDSTAQEGRYWAAWSHGSWRGATVRASAAGYQPAEVSIGWGRGQCNFRLARENAHPNSSKGLCDKSE